jgi:hypothetical protein
VVDALERIHATLAEDGVVLDTQPISAEPPIFGDDGQLGTLDMREWAGTIAAVDDQIVRAVEQGLFSIDDERHIVVTDAYDDLAELVRVTGDWEGTSIPSELAKRAAQQRGPVELRQDVRIRVLHRL